MSLGWKSCILYTMFIGRRDRAGEVIEEEAFDRVRDGAEQVILQELRGLTEIRVVEAVGKTAEWPPEDSCLMVVLTDNLQRGDTTLEAQTTKMAEVLKQDQVWLTKQFVMLFVVKGV